MNTTNTTNGLTEAEAKSLAENVDDSDDSSPDNPQWYTFIHRKWED